MADQDNESGGFGTGNDFRYSDLRGANINAPQNTGTQTIGAITQNQGPTMDEVVAALGQLRNLIADAGHDHGAQLGPDLDAVDQALQNLPGASPEQKKTRAQTGMEALKRFYDTACKIPGFVAATNEVLVNVNRIGGFLADQCGQLWTHTAS